MNKVMLIGNVGQDPQVKYLDQGVCVAQVRIATTERGYTMQNGTQVPERTEWHNCIFWRKQDRQGISRRSVDIIVENMEMLSPKSSTSTAPPSPTQPTTPPAATPSGEKEPYPF